MTKTRSTLPPLPIEWIKRIFAHFNAVYGPALMRGIWGDEDLSSAWSLWAIELAFYKYHPSAIKYALKNLPADYPPNLIQFKEICQDGLRHEAQSRPALTSKPTKIPDNVRRQILDLVDSKKM